VRVPARMVGVLRPRGGTPEHLPPGRLDPTTHSELLLAAVARLARTAEASAPTGTEGATVEGGTQFQRRLGPGSGRQPPQGPEQRGAATSRLPHAIRSCGPHVDGRCVQPPYAENRTYGGVGGCRGAIPGTRPDRSGGVVADVKSALNGVGEWGERERGRERRLTTAATETRSSRGREVRAEWRWRMG